MLLRQPNGQLQSHHKYQETKTNKQTNTN